MGAAESRGESGSRDRAAETRALRVRSRRPSALSRLSARPCGVTSPRLPPPGRRAGSPIPEARTLEGAEDRSPSPERAQFGQVRQTLLFPKASQRASEGSNGLRGRARSRRTRIPRVDRALHSRPRFFLAERPVVTGAPGRPLCARLLPEEAAHARRVLRLRPGDLALGLDGEGGAWPLAAVAGTAGDELVFEVEGEPWSAPGYGEPDAPLPWIEVAVAWPRKARAEEMIGRLVQLGAAAITPLAARFTSAEPCPAETPERWLKLAREACKQCRREWLPRFHAASTPAELAERTPRPVLAVLDQEGGMALDTWLRSLVPGRGGVGTRSRPITLAIGPEGGFHPVELEALREADATAVSVGPHVLRIETAAEAALAVTACVLARGGAPHLEV